VTLEYQGGQAGQVRLGLRQHPVGERLGRRGRPADNVAQRARRVPGWHQRGV
jgi:hypothetical protein